MVISNILSSLKVAEGKIELILDDSKLTDDLGLTVKLG